MIGEIDSSKCRVPSGLQESVCGRLFVFKRVNQMNKSQLQRLYCLFSQITYVNHTYNGRIYEIQLGQPCLEWLGIMTFFSMSISEKIPTSGPGIPTAVEE